MHLILIVLDSLRADHLGCYGYARRTSPNIDKLAAQGTVFEQAIAQSGITCPSHTALFTGTYPITNGIYGNVGTGMLPADIPTLAELLRQAGYRTGAFPGNWILDSMGTLIGLDRGFDLYLKTPQRRQASDNLREALAWLRPFRKDNTFTFILLWEPHGPYRSPEKRFNHLFIKDDVSKTNNKILPLANDETGKGGIPPHQKLGFKRDFNFYVSQYDGQIAYADSCLGEFFAALENDQILKNAVVAITSDHGEAMGENDSYFVHGHALTEEMIRVPLIVSGGAFPRGIRAKAPVQHIDLMPTFLQLAGVDSDIIESLPGANLLEAVEEGDNRQRETFSAMDCDEVMNCAVRALGFKYLVKKIGAQESEELYDLSAEKPEVSNLLGQMPQKGEEMRQRFHRWWELYYREPGTEKIELDEEVKMKLRGLGYI